MPDAHAKLSPSSSSMWLYCTPSALLNAEIEDKDTSYTKEGTLAHSYAEMELRHIYWNVRRAQKKKLEADELFDASMPGYVEKYTGYVQELYAEAQTRCEEPEIYIEQRVSFDPYIPDSFGTADCVIITPGVMDVIDLKYGQGVPVSADHNSQLSIYGIGCLLEFDWLYDIQTVRLHIVQPRLDSISSWETSAEDLLTWAKEFVAPRAALAAKGEGEFAPGEKTCRWCKIAGTCKHRAAFYKDKMEQAYKDLPQLSTTEIGQILTWATGYKRWLTDVEAAAEAKALSGIPIPGWKLVAGRSTRKITHPEELEQKLINAGFKDIYTSPSLLGITGLEKVVGKKKLTELSKGLIEKPEGKPTLVSDDDPRPEIKRQSAFDIFNEEDDYD